MLKDTNTDKFENESHFSYKEYKKNVKKESHRDITVFISVFVIGVLIILGFAKILSPNVDVSISDESGLASESIEDEDDKGSSIDDRLKVLKLEDEGKEAEDEVFTPSLDEKVVLPKGASQPITEVKEVVERVSKQTEHEQKEQTPATVVPPSQQSQNTSAPTPAVNAKVVVGYYATEQQAEVAKSILQEAGLGINPVIKHLGGYYTLQVGSYSSKDRAQQVANNLIKNNYPARVIVE